jgi:hypothetical protein
MSRHERPRTADEVMAELEQKPEFVERQRQLMAAREENRRRYADAAAELLAELAEAGFDVETMAQLRRHGVGDRRAVPILVKWLPAVTYLPLKRDIIATLGSTWARPVAARPLVEEFLRIDPAMDNGDSSVRWSISDALERVADESVLDEVIEIATDDRHGAQRGPAIVALGNMHRARARVTPILVELLGDDEVAGYAIMGLGKLKAGEARSALMPFLEHREGWIRHEAKKALKRLGLGP